jgi:hypothetical protein
MKDSLAAKETSEHELSLGVTFIGGLLDAGDGLDVRVRHGGAGSRALTQLTVLGHSPHETPV